LGKIKIAGINLGIAAILFTSLAFGSLSPDIKLPAVIYEIGLVLFIYCIDFKWRAVRGYLHTIRICI
jgi:putative transport protein